MVSLLPIMSLRQSNLGWCDDGKVYRTCGNDVGRPGRQTLPRPKVEPLSAKSERQIPIDRDRDIMHKHKVP
jgi:hypothetical protein